MKKKLLTTAALVLVIIMCSATLMALSACDGEEEFPTWNIASGVTASFSDNGNYGYVLTVSGNGIVPDYASPKDTPWYGKSGRVTQIVIEQGITYVGSNAFSQCVAVKSVELPKSVKKVGENAFSSKTKIINADTVTKILFVGNSFTFYNDMPQIFAAIATDADAKVMVESLTESSWRLDKWADAADTRGADLDAKLKANDDYDVIVLQEQSTRPLNHPDDFLAGATALAKKIKQTQTNCDVYLYATWGYPTEAESRKVTIPQMESQIRSAYQSVAAAIGATVCHVGAAFSYVYQNHKDVNLYHTDNMHPSYAGSYLSACVHAATILGIDLNDVTYNGSLDEATAALLRNAAYAIVTGA